MAEKCTYCNKPINGEKYIAPGEDDAYCNEDCWETSIKTANMMNLLNEFGYLGSEGW